MDFQAPEPQSPFEGYVIAMLGEVYTNQKEIKKRLGDLEKQSFYMKGIAAGFGFLAGLLSVAFGKLIPWR